MSDAVVVYKGEDKVLKFYVQTKEGVPFDLGSPTQVKFQFIQTDDTMLEKNLSTGVSILSAPRGEIQVLLSAENTSLLKASLNQDVKLFLTYGTEIKIVYFKRVLTVV